MAGTTQGHQIGGVMVILAPVDVVSVEQRVFTLGPARSTGVPVAFEHVPLQRGSETRRVGQEASATLPEVVVLPGLVRPKRAWGCAVVAGTTAKDVGLSGCRRSPNVLSARLAWHPFPRHLLGLDLPAGRRALAGSITVDDRLPGQLRRLPNDRLPTMTTRGDSSLSTTPARYLNPAPVLSQALRPAGVVLGDLGFTGLDRADLATDGAGDFGRARPSCPEAFGATERPGAERHSAREPLKLNPAMPAWNLQPTPRFHGDYTVQSADLSTKGTCNYG